jgi:hypothetical protein
LFGRFFFICSEVRSAEHNDSQGIGGVTDRQTDLPFFGAKSGDEGPEGVESELKVSRVLEVLKNFSLGLHTGVLTFEFCTF